MTDTARFLSNIWYFTDILSKKEPEIIPKLQGDDLIFKSNDVELDRISPVDPWTHQKIAEQHLPLPVLNALATGDVVDAFLGTNWIGSTQT